MNLTYNNQIIDEKSNNSCETIP